MSSLLRLGIPEELRLVGLADQSRLGILMQRVSGRITACGCSLVAQKAKVFILTKRRVPTLQGRTDTQFKDELFQTNQSRNGQGCSSCFSLMLANGYGTEGRAVALGKEAYHKQLAQRQRRRVLMVALSYRDVSDPAVLLPFLYRNSGEVVAHGELQWTVNEWQNKKRGKCIERLIGNSGVRLNGKYGAANYILTQLFSGGEGFQPHLQKIEKTLFLDGLVCNGVVEDTGHNYFLRRVESNSSINLFKHV